MFGKDLVVMAEFDGEKTIDEIEFNFIPIWVRILKMPLGLMNKAAGEVIGALIGEVMEVDADDDDGDRAVHEDKDQTRYSQATHAGCDVRSWRWEGRKKEVVPNHV